MDVFITSKNELSLSVAPNGTVTVDWGDGTAASTITGTSLGTRKKATHTYAQIGSYTIKLTSSDPYRFYGGTSSSHTGPIAPSSYTAGDKTYAASILNIRMGNNSGVSAYGLADCYKLKTITIHKDMTSIGDGAFNYCYSLVAAISPYGNTDALSCSYGYNMVCCSNPSGVTSGRSESYMYSIESITVPDGTTSLVSSQFRSCISLKKVMLPSSITSIGNSAFQECYSLIELHLKSSTPPTLGTNVLQKTGPSLVIYVPTASLTDYQGASNWSSYSSQMVGE